MPQAIPVIVGYVASYFAASGWVVAAVYAAAAVAVGMYQGQKAKRDAKSAFNSSLEDRLVMQATTDGPRSRVYGRVRNCDGILFKGTYGPNSERYVMVVAVAGHEVDAIETVYFNDQAVTTVPASTVVSDGRGGEFVTTAPFRALESASTTQAATASGGSASITLQGPLSAGSVVYATANDVSYSVTISGGGTIATATGVPDGTTVDFNYQRDVGTHYARIWRYTGTASQNIGADVLMHGFPTLVTPSDRFAGIACVVVEFYYSQDAFPAGVPNVSAVMRGAKVHDPRTGLTVWTENPALIARDWSLYANGGGCTTSHLIDSSFIAAANACDISTAFSLAGGGTETRPRYQCGIVCRLDANPGQWLNEIVESMAGKSGWCGGRLRVTAGIYRSPVTTITEDWLSGFDEISIVKDQPRSELVNIYRPSIANAGVYAVGNTEAAMSTAYVTAPAPEVRSTAFIAADGQELAQEIDLGGVTRAVHAQHICGVLMRDARDALTIKLPCNMRAFQLELFDTVWLTLPAFGFNAKEFEILNWEFSMQGGVILTMKETAASIYDPASGLGVLDAAQNTTLPLPWVVQVPTGMTVASGTSELLLQADGTVVSRLLVTWDPMEDASVVDSGAVEVQWKRADAPADEWQSLEMPGYSKQVYISDVEDKVFYVVRIRASNTLKVRSKWAPALVALITGKTAPPGNVTGLARTVVASGVRITWDENTEVDYATTEVRVGTSWASSSLLFSGKATGYTWLSPAVGTYTVWAKHYDTSANASVAAVSISVTVTTADAVNWTSIVGRPKLYRIIARGYVDTQRPAEAAIYDGETGGVLVAPSLTYTVVRIRRSDGVITYSSAFNLLSGGTSAALSMATALNASGPDSIVVVFTYDEPQSGRLTPALLTAMKRCGASSGVFGSPEFRFRSAYILVGIPGCGEGQGHEAYQGDVDSAANAWTEVNIQLANGVFTVGGSSAAARTLRDFSYIGDLNAAAGISLVPRGNCVVQGSTVTKNGGAAAWDSDAYSRDGYLGGAACSFVAAQTNAEIMAGLNADPAADSSFTSIDAAWYLTATAQCFVYENGAPITSVLHAYAAGDIFSVTYDGTNARYFHNGILHRTVAFTPSVPIYFDSSIGTPGGAIANVQFGPLTSIKEPMDAAAAAAAAASAAQTAANTANAAIANISSDNVLSKGEKPQVVLDWTAINDEFADIVAKAAAQGLSSTAYQTARTNLSSYLSSISPAYNDFTQDSTIIGTTFRTNFANLYSARQALLNLIAVTIANGAVGTPQLGNEAATTLIVNKVASGSGGGPSSIVSTSWVNTTSGTVPVQIDYAIKVLVALGATGVQIRFSSTTTSSPGGFGAFSKIYGASQEMFTYFEQRDVLAGETITASFILPSGATTNYSDAIIRMSAIKR